MTTMTTTTTEENDDMAKAKAAESERFDVYLRADQLKALREIQERDGVSVAHMIRSGVDRELAARGVKGARHGR